jgi:DNA ligase (NAD+)
MSNLVKKVSKDIIKYKRAYYAGNPLISDLEYDELEEKLRAIDPDNPVLNIVGNVDGGNILHDPPMLSCDKKKDMKSVLRWAGDRDIIWGYKVDGMSLEIEYVDGEIFRGSTRGNGFMGEEITRNVLKISNIPKKIPATGNIKVRGEAYISIQDFENILLVEGVKHRSARNLATGTLLSKESGLVSSRNVCFISFEIIMDEEMDAISKISMLEKWGFEVADMGKIEKEEIEEIHSSVEKNRNDIKYEIDGIVLKYNDPNDREDVGSTSHHPKWMVALKFDSDSKNSEIVDIQWQVGKSGTITPVAIIEPVELCGAVIRKVTMHNAAYVKENGIGIGDVVEVIRSGDVIPKIEKVVENNDNPEPIPDYCPECASKVKYDGIRAVCTNKNCNAQMKRKVVNFTNVVGIEHLGNKTIQRLFDIGYISSAPDLYNLTKTMLEDEFGLNGLKIHKEIQSKRILPLDIFLASLGLKNLSVNRSRKIADSIESLSNLNYDNLIKIDGIGKKTATSIMMQMMKKENWRPLLDHVKISKSGTKPIQEGKLSGKIVYVSGTIDGYSKKDLGEIVIKNGGSWGWGVSKPKKRILVLGENYGKKKVEQAGERGIKTWSSEEFKSMMGI